MLNRLWLVGLLVLPLAVAGRTPPRPDTIRVGQVRSRLSLNSHATLTVSSRTATRATAQTAPNGGLLRTSQLAHAHQAYWLHVWLRNDTDTTQTLYLSGANNQHVTLYKTVNGQTDSLRFGWMISSREWPTPENEKYAPITLRAGQVANVWVRVANAQGLLPTVTDSPLPRPSLHLSLLTDTARTARLLRDRQTNAVELQNRS